MRVIFKGSHSDLATFLAQLVREGVTFECKVFGEGETEITFTGGY